MWRYTPLSWAGIAQSVWWLGTDCPGIKFRWGRYFPHPSRPTLGLNQPPTQWVLAVFPGGKAAGEGSWLSTPSSAEVKGRVELYPCSPSGPTWPVLGWPLPLYSNIIKLSCYGTSLSRGKSFLPPSSTTAFVQERDGTERQTQTISNADSVKCTNIEIFWRIIEQHQLFLTRSVNYASRSKSSGNCLPKMIFQISVTNLHLQSDHL